MKLLKYVLLFLCLLLTVSIRADGMVAAPLLADSFPKFDEWGDILFSDERARLDNVAIQWQHQPQSIIYLVVYAGRRACVGEAKARGIRAKNHLVRRQVSSEHIVWIDGGWRKEVTTEVWLLPSDIGKPYVFPEFNLNPSEVTLEKNCKIKRRRQSSG